MPEGRSPEPPGDPGNRHARGAGSHGRWSRLELPALLVAGALPFLHGLGRGLVSEDFIILRRLWEQPFWSLAWEQLRGPWMGAPLVLFWRPFSTFVLQLQVRLWGVTPWGHLAVLLAAHLVGAALLFLLVQRLLPGERWAPRLAALAFAVYPLHPNSVLFIASFATVYGTVLCLGSLLLFVVSRERGGAGALAGSVLLFALALASYEGSFVLPGLLLLVDLLRSRERAEPIALLPLIRRHAPFLLLAAGYLLLRRLLLGAAIGGYPGREFQLPTAWALLERLQPRWSYLLAPFYDLAHPRWVEHATRTGLAVAAALSFLRRGARPRWILAGLAWIALSRLPFGDTGVVPANGRYWYLASAGIGLLLGGVVSGLVRSRNRERAMAVVTAVVALLYGMGAFGSTRDSVRASRLVSRIRAQGVRTLGPGDRDAPRFVAGVPPFVVDRRGHNVAQVFFWGLADAFSRPFTDPPIRVFPLGEIGAEEAAPLVRSVAHASLWRWTGVTFERVEPGPALPESIAIGSVTDIVRGVRFRAEPDVRCRVFTIGRMNPVVAEAGAAAGWRTVPLPVGIIRSTWHLYGDELYVWVEAISPAGRPVASSPVLRLRPPGGP